MSDLSGQIIAGRYRVDQFIGRGGMADVYKVWDKERAAFLAMKVLHEGLAEDQIFLRRFRREAQNLAKLKHPNIVRFYEMGQDVELVFMLMEYVDGITLSKARNRMGKAFTPAQALGILQPVCFALHFAHQKGLIHCDIKPGNIMIDRTGRPLLTDFGIARMSEGATTATMVGAGTPAYMSPEQVAGADPSPETDIYALGVVLYELATGGERPFTGERATITGTVGEKIRWEQRSLPPPSPREYNPSIGTELEEVILCCLSKDPKERYHSVMQMLERLTKAVGVPPEPLPAGLFVREEKRSEQVAPPVPAAPAAPAPPARRRRSHWGYWIAGGGVLGVAALGFAIVGGLLAFPILPFGNASPTAQPPTLAPTATARIVTQIVTATPVKQPTARPTARVVPTSPPRPTPTPGFSVTQEHRSNGYYVVVTGGMHGYDESCGPLPPGQFIAEEKEQKFAAYVDETGIVYVVRFSDCSFPINGKLDKDQFTFLKSHYSDPRYDLYLQIGGDGRYVVTVTELNYGGTQTIRLFRSSTE